MPRSPNGCSKKGRLNAILETVEKTVTVNEMFEPGDKVLAAVSGGPDSVALVNMLAQLAPRLSITLGIAHLNHNLRPEAGDEARFVEALAQELALPFYQASEDVAAFRRRHGLSLETAAREVRYTFYKQVATTAGYRKIALGHHSADNAEMVLMNLLRGAGPLGLSGIPPVRDNLIVRPLIDLSREQIDTYLDGRGLTWVSDPSNADTRFTRNRIRHTLLPLIEKEFNANILATLHRTAAITGDENRWLDSMAAPLGDAIITRGDKRQLSLDTTALNALDRAPARRVVRRAIAMLKGDLHRVTFTHVDAIRDLAANPKTDARVDLPGLISASRQSRRLVLKIMETPRQPLESGGPPISYRYQVEAEQCLGKTPVTLNIATGGGRLTFLRREAGDDIDIRGSGQQTAFFDIDQLTFPLVIRNYQPGDRLTPLGMSGTKKLKKLFGERKVNPPDRRRCPVLISGGEIVWVPGHRRAEACKINRRTRWVLEAKFALPDEK